MRIERLSLLRFGPFRDLTLELRPGRLGLIAGSNEAGKSTALRALRGFLYGIPARTSDAHRHAMKDLQIGARIVSDAGESWDLIRRKGLKNTLLDASGLPLDDDPLEVLLAGTSAELFASMYGLTHEDLTVGGKELLAAQGSMGESLFGAALGLRGAHALARELRAEADALFSRDARKKPINLALLDHRDARSKMRSLALAPATWAGLDADLRGHRDRLARSTEALDCLDAELARARRVQRVLPALAKRETIQRAISEHSAPEISEDARAERERAEREIDDARVRLRQLSGELAALRERRAKLRVPEILLAREEVLSELREAFGAYRKAKRDRLQLEGRASAERQSAREVLRELGTSASAEGVALLDAPARLRLRRLVHEGEGNARVSREVRQSLESSRRALHLHREVPVPDDCSEPLSRLRDALLATRSAAALPEELHTLGAEIASLREEIAKACGALPLWSRDARSLAGCAVPALETVDRFRTDFEETERRLAASQRRLEEAREQVADLGSQIEQLERAGSVPTESGLEAARQKRDAHWLEVRAHWLAGKDDAAKHAPREARALARSYEASVEGADDTADRLREESARAAEHATLTRQREATIAKITLEEAAYERLRKAEAELAADWATAWRAVCAEPLPPTEMRGWLAERARILQQVSRCAEKRHIEESLERRVAEAAALLAQALGATRDEAQSLAALDARAARTLEALEARQAEREQRLEERARLERELAEAESRQSTAEREQQEWLASWRVAVEGLGLGDEVRFEQVEAVLELRDQARAHEEQARESERRIAAIDADGAHFERELRALLRDAAPELADLETEPAALGLDALYRQGLADRQEAQIIDQRLQALESESSALQARLDSAQATLTRLCERAGCASPKELPAREEAARAFRAHVEALRQLEDEQLSAEGVPIEVLEREAAGFDDAELEARIAALAREREALVAERDQLTEKIGELRGALELRDGRSEAAMAAADAQEALARVGRGVEHYVRLRLAEWCLRRQVEAHRERTQAPVLARAGEWVDALTLGAYTALEPGFDSRDELVIELARADGTRVGVAGLSQGTRDQLYLALRLASLESRLGAGESLPLVMDDVLVHFDDARSRAALAGLGALAQRTQVLLFTHHARVVELAREAVPEDALDLHDLDDIGRGCLAAGGSGVG